MRVLFQAAPWAIGLALSLAIILFPAFQPPVRRDAARDIAGVRQAECEYRGITATFEELTRAYVLQTYRGGELMRWESRPSPQNPDSEALVTGIFAVEGVKPRVGETPEQIVVLRQDAAPAVGITWRYSTLASVRIVAANDYAVDAVAVYRRTVDSFIARMLVVASPTTIRRGPGERYPVVREVDAGTVLLREPAPEERPSAPGWRHIRIPSSTVTGWVTEQELETLEHVQ